ncbi:hypothetical protein NA56DRAFT_566558 [Hyaloscypha hepaticicola]|uniref:Uncharacterized protein n=1 Tax=Hyaloscypha hepaticicola TaxID=2082293 RepID=A0A2J6QDR1_9HELO|nr:hypothetical protein NA56DRAFT_566558 [Hyaloscypha hepaticicola]
MSWKSALVERWRNKRGVPGQLENFSGLEVSLCTQNARRVRLLSLLGSNTMRHYLHSLSFSWPLGFFWETYFEAFQSVNQFRIFWNRHRKLPEMDKIKEAIAESLEILQGTGVNNFSWELGALWVAVKFVKVPGYPVLATSPFVNESILESKQLVSKKLRGLSCRKWDTRGLCATAKFSLADHGELEVLTTPTRSCPVTTMEWQGVIGLKESWNEIKDADINEEFFGRGRTPHHKEHISGEWETLPLPILIISKASKPLLLK